MSKQSYPCNITIKEASRIIHQFPYALTSELIPLDKATKRILAEDIFAPEHIPSFARSPYDGYALRSEDTIYAVHNNPITLTIIEEIPAGSVPTKSLASKQAAKILTGAPLPDGADCVIKYEDTCFTNKHVTISSPLASFSNVCPIGEDIQKNSLVIPKGHLLEHRAIATLASLGIRSVPVFKNPIVSLISTGNEVVSISDPLTMGMIRNSSRYLIEGHLKDNGATPIFCGIANDNIDSICHHLKEALEKSDLVITTGGASVGDYDLIIPAIERLGGEILFWKVTMRPGGSFIVGRIGQQMIIGLSGNPGSATVALHMLVLPYIRQISGQTNIYPQPIEFFLFEDEQKQSPMDRLIRGKLHFEQGQVFFKPLAKQKNSMVHTVIDCDCICHIPAHQQYQAGEKARGYLLYQYNDINRF